MKKIVITAIAGFLITLHAGAQDKYFTKSGKIEFESKAALENIEARHKSVTSVLDTKTGNLQFAVLMKGFEFEKALMQEHFNENYVESHKFPKAEFKGQIVNNGEINYTKDGSYSAKVRGKLTLHGETRDVETIGTVLVKSGKILTVSSFNILLSDFKVEIPKLVKDNISNNVKITVDCALDPFKG